MRMPQCQSRRVLNQHRQHACIATNFQHLQTPCTTKIIVANQVGFSSLLGQHIYCVVSLLAAVAIVLIQVSSGCKEIHFEQIGCHESLELATTVFEVSKSHCNQRTKTTKFEISSHCAHTVQSSTQLIATSKKMDLQTYRMTE